MESRMNADSDAGSVPDVDSGNRHVNLVQFALRITFFIVGPVPVMMVSVSLAAAIELITELIAWDSSYYQDHAWCPVVACMVAGSVCFALRRIPYLESGRWIGPLIIALGVYMALQ
jgi:hypothetical protein